MMMESADGELEQRRGGLGACHRPAGTLSMCIEIVDPWAKLVSKSILHPEARESQPSGSLELRFPQSFRRCAAVPCERLCPDS